MDGTSTARSSSIFSSPADAGTGTEAARLATRHQPAPAASPSPIVIGRFVPKPRTAPPPTREPIGASEASVQSISSEAAVRSVSSEASARSVSSEASARSISSEASDPPLYEPPPLSITRRTSAPAAPRVPDPAFDARLVTILDAPLAIGETAMAGFARKERELGAAFATLHVIEARALHLRLANPRPDDTLADKFGRLTTDRRHRLLTFLADARRRAAIAAAARR